jgi:hypothetical protein
MDKITPRPKKQFVPNAFKFMVAMSSVAGTVGIWNLLANKDLIQANAQNIPDGQPTVVSSLEPLPTVAQLLVVDQTVFDQAMVQATPMPIATLRSVARPTAVVVYQPAPIIIGNNGNNSSAPAPVNPPVVSPTDAPVVPTDAPPVIPTDAPVVPTLNPTQPPPTAAPPPVATSTTSK